MFILASLLHQEDSNLILTLLTATWDSSSLQVANTLLQPTVIFQVQTQLVPTVQTEGTMRFNQNWN